MPLTRSRVAAALLLGLVASLAPTSARAQSQAVRDYVLLARDSITISQSQIGAGDVGVLDGALTSPRSLTAPLSTLAAPTVRVGDEAVCRGIHATSTRGGGPGCREAGAFARPFSTTTGACAFPDPFPECDPFATRVIVPRGATLALPPGAYSDILVEGGAGGSGVLLLNGSYTLCSLRLSRDATVNFTGPTTLYVDGSLTSGNDTAFEPRAGVPVDQVQVFVAGRLVRFNRKASVGALVCAPDATVRITNGVTLRGQVVGDSMRIRRSTLTLETGAATTTTTTIANASTTTTTLPSPGRCGDGVVDPGEVCDGDVTCTSPGGSFLDCSACGSFTSGSCTPPPSDPCGNGVSDPGEECDDGNAADCDGCSARCTVERVGNGIVDCDEECDDGNTVDCDGCDSSGTLECGNDVIDGECGEVCDGGNVAGQTCAGGVVTCAADCRSVDRSQCPVDSAPAEVCGNCIDDDLDGLIDYEDPSCCSGPALDGAILKKLRLKARRRGGTAVRLRANLGPNASRVVPARDQIVLQARTASGAPLLCAQVPGLRAKHRVFRFRDPKHRVAAAQSLDVVRLRATKRGQLRLMARGKRTQLPMPAPGQVQVTVAAVDPASGEARCAAMQTALRHGRGRVMRAP